MTEGDNSVKRSGNILNHRHGLSSEQGKGDAYGYI